MYDDLAKLDIAQAIEEIKRHRLEDDAFWKDVLPMLDDNEAHSRSLTLLARCMGERSFLLRLMGHLVPALAKANPKVGE